MNMLARSVQQMSDNMNVLATTVVQQRAGAKSIHRPLDMLQASAAPMTLTLEEQSGIVEIPLSKLLVVRDTITRSKNACATALAGMMSGMQAIQAEAKVLQEAEQLINEVVQTSQSSTM